VTNEARTLHCKLKFEHEDKQLLNIKQLCLNLKAKEKNFTGDNRKKRRYLEQKYKDYRREAPQLRNLVSYVGNKNIPFLSLYRYKEAFSYGLVLDTNALCNPLSSKTQI